ncbi:MAG: PaaI family thioesterase [Cycloclasticus sp.]|nr:PaaI family thioesterase [Cycloclasticus sp.]
MKPSIQEKMRPNNCFGCGHDNPYGLRIKSYWEGDTSVCRWTPEEFMIGPPDCLYGGISASLIDCHSVNTALSFAHEKSGNSEQYDRRIQMVTGTLTIKYLKPVPMEEVELRAVIQSVDRRKYMVKTELLSKGVVCVTGDVIAIRIDQEQTE